jgi:mRNA interferase RelE/StbE
MKTYKVRLERKAQKNLTKVPEPYYSNIKTALLDLGKNPRPPGFIKLKGRDAFRIRVADYRIIYEIQDAILLVDVVDLGHRKDIYK